ncbi:MAG: DUF484 family protein [Granulosicoccus sp.]
MQPEQTDIGNEIDPDAVVKYLIRNPEFFVSHQDILTRLRVPHDSGKAVSLIEKQVSVLRGKCGHLEKSLCDLIAVARQNESLHERLHLLNQEIITASNLPDIVKLTQNCLRTSFNAEDVHLMLIAPAPKRAPRKKASENKATDKAGKPKTSPRQRAPKLEQVKGATTVRHTDKRVKQFDALFKGRETVCGMPSDEQLRAMVGPDHANVGSAAMIPLQFERKLGVVMLTSRDESRFGANKGVMFLNQMGELLSRRIHSYVAHAQAAKK